MDGVSHAGNFLSRKKKKKTNKTKKDKPDGGVAVVNGESEPSTSGITKVSVTVALLLGSCR